jgi:endonuclease YncB( thermonuclease family)
MSSFLESQKAWLAAEQAKLDAQKALVESSQAQVKTGRPVTFLDEMKAYVSGEQDKPGRRFKVENVVDGDTMDLAGFGRVRLAGIDTPETVHPTKGVQKGGPEASNFTKKMAAGKFVTVKLQRGDTEDKYGRALTVLEDEEGNIFNTEIVKAGHSRQIAGVPTGAPITTPEVGRLWRETVEAAKTGMKRGLLYPVSSIFVEDYRRLQREGDIHRRNLVQEMDSRGIVDGSVRDTVAMAPEVVGELIGGLPANALTYYMAGGATGIAKATSLGGKAIRSMGAAGLSSASLSAMAQIDNGESRFAHMAKDFAIGGMFEVVGLPLMRKAWTAEIGEKVARDATTRIAKDLGVEPEIVATHIDALRSGGVGADIRVITRLEAELAKNPTAAASPLGQIVNKGASDWYHNVIPTQVSINPNLREVSPNFGVRGMVSARHPISGEVQNLPFHIMSDPANRPRTEGSHVVSKFEQETMKLQQEIDKLKQAGFEAKMDFAEVQHPGAWSRFSGIMYGTNAPSPVHVHVPKGTYAAKSQKPSHGETVRDDITGKTATVVDEVAADDMLGSPEVISVLRSSSLEELREAWKIAKNSKDLQMAGLIQKEAARRDAAGVKGAADEALAGIEASQAKPVPASMELPKGSRVQGVLFKWDESAGSRSTNEMGVAGYKRKSGENRLVMYLNAAKQENVLRELERKRAAGQLSEAAERVLSRREAKGRLRETRAQRLRDEAAAFRGKSDEVTDEVAGRVPMTVEERAAEQAMFKERATARQHAGTVNLENPWVVRLRTDAGKIESRTLAQVTPMETVLQHVSKPSLGLRPHSTGQVRRGVVDLEAGKVEMEAFDNPSLEWDSPEMKLILDDDNRVGHAPRFFMHDGGVTFSIPNTQQYDPLRGEWSMRSLEQVQGYEAKVMDVGPIDTLAAYQRPPRVYTTSGTRELSYTQDDAITRRFGLINREKRMANRDVGGLTTRITTRPGNRGITSGEDIKGRIASRRSATSTWYKDSTGEWREKDSKLGGQYETFATRADEVEASGRFPAGFSSNKASDYSPGPFHERTTPRTLDSSPNELEPGMVTERPPSFAISKEAGTNHLELASAKKMAQVMIKEGADPSTKVRITVSGGQWDDLDAPFEWTLEELSKTQFKPVNWRSMTAVAQSRGYQAVPDGFSVILKSPWRSTTFASGEEALSFLSRIPRQKKYSAIIEKDLLEAWALGGPERATDYHVDVSRYRPVNLQESSITEVVGGRSAATLISSHSEESLKASVQGLAKSQKVGGVYEVLNLTPAETMIQPEGQAKMTVKEKMRMAGEKRAEIPQETTSRGRVIYSKETLAKQKMEKAAQQAAAPPPKPEVPKYQTPDRFLVYEESAVKAKILQNQATLKKMGIDISQPTPMVLRQLAKYGKGSGLDFLLGQRDANDMLMYAQLRQWNKASLIMQAGKQNDVHGGFRVFGPELRKKIGATLAEAPPPTSYDPALASRLPNHPGGYGGPEQLPGPGGKKITGVLAEPMDSGTGSGGGIPPELNEVGDLLKDIGGGSGDERIPLLELTPDAHEEVEALQVIENTRGFKLSDYFRVPMQLFKEYQAATGIPFYRWWEQIDHGRTQVTRFTNPVFNQIHALTRGIRPAERQQVGQLFELRYADPAGYAKMHAASSELVQKGEGLLDQTMRNFLTEMGLDPEKELKELPYFRKRNVDIKEMRPYESGRPPNPITRKSNAFMEDLPLDEREYDFSVTMKRYARAVAHEKFLAPQWDEINKTMGELMGVSSDPATEHMIQLFNKHRAEVVHAQDRLGYGMAVSVKNIGKRLGMDFSLEESQDIISSITGANYFANLAFNLGVTGRNYLQVLQTVYPVMGAKATAHGVRKALEWRKSPSLRKTMAELDIVNTDTMLEGLSNIQQVLLESDKMTSLAKPFGKVADLMNKGVAMYQKADDFNKVASYYAQYYHAEKAAQSYLKDGNWGKFLVDSKLEFRDIRIKNPQTGEMMDGPLMQRVKGSLAAGQPKTAAHMMALDFAKESQFMYSRGNVPYAMQSTAGRLLGQYGTWPAWYVEWFGNNMMFRRGSTESNIKNMARWAGVNATLFYGMSEVFGVDFARWTFFAPLSYQGGPLAQVAQQGLAAFGAAASGDDDPVARIQAERLKGAWKQLIPAPIVAGRATLGAVDKAMDGEYAESVKQFLGLPSTKKER